MSPDRLTRADKVGVGTPDTCAKLGVGSEPEDGLGERGGVTRRREESHATHPYCLTNTGNVRPYNRKPGRHGLGRAAANELVPRAEDCEVCSAQEPAHITHFTRESHVVA